MKSVDLEIDSIAFRTNDDESVRRSSLFTK